MSDTVDIAKASKVIAVRREQLGITYEKIAQIVGVQRSTVRKWEKGMIKRIGNDKLELLAEALNISPVSFIRGKIILIGEEEFSFSEHEKEVIKAYRNRPDLQPGIDELLGISKKEPVHNMS